MRFTDTRALLAERPAVGLTGGPASRTSRLTTTADGKRLAVDIYPSPEARAAVVVVHGFTAHRRDASVAAVAASLHEAGYAVLSFDARGHGESSGVCTLGDAEQYDVEAVVALARDLSDDVVVVGASMGAIATLRFAANTVDELAGVVTVSCPARWRLLSARTALAAGLTQTPPGRWFLRRTTGVRLASGWRRPEAPESLVARVTYPLAIVHGLADRFLPWLEASRLHDRARGQRRLDLVPAMGHAFDAAGTATVVSAVAWCLSPTHHESSPG